MPASPAEAFERRHLKRNDGDKVLPPSMALVAALEAGYRFKLSFVEEAAASAKYPGLLTMDEFISLCERNPDSSLDAEEMAKHVSVLAPGGFVTRASLHEAAAKAGSSEDSLNTDEIDALFNALDEENTGSISAERLMEVINGKQGKEMLYKQRKEYSKAKIAAEELAAEKERAAERERAAKEAAAAAAAAAKPATPKPPQNAAPENKEQKKAMCGC
ncbi:I/6 autoantigen [Trypanosoma grayi]|uniref:I/6 autoantigen n=1 Tax=Trypanosoma grayi TaxID=71804 RepID=UPI0004F49658|nr:I/6 autoantigen [Trypanosoma grayi]KEG07464.1 I/6 autoantigen [Trypanosoma grayi]